MEINDANVLIISIQIWIESELPSEHEFKRNYESEHELKTGSAIELQING